MKKTLYIALAIAGLLAILKFFSAVAGAQGEPPETVISTALDPAMSVKLSAESTQEEPPPQPHTNEPGQCTSYCYPPGYEGARPKGTPEGIKGYECQGDHCSKAASEGEENPCDENGEKKCSRWCAKPCCSCLAVCI